MIPTVSVVVLNWNSGALGAKAAESVLAQTHDRVELVIVDNGSDDDSLAKIKLAAPDAVYVQLATNRGFAAGMNAGIAATESDFVVPLNCDATLDPNFVRSALAVHWAHPKTAVVGAKVRSADHVSGPLDLTWTMRVAFRDTDHLTICHKADGSCPVMRREALDQVIDTFGSGPYDESYDTYGEDLDLALKLHRLGWEIRFDPDTTAEHVRSFSSARRLADKRGRLRINSLRNRHRNIIRHAPGLRGLGAWAGAAVQDFGFAARQLLRRDPKAFADVAAAWSGVARTVFSDLRFRAKHRKSAQNLPAYRVSAGKR